MHHSLKSTLLITSLALTLPLCSLAAPRDDVLNQYAGAAKAASPAFAGFSATRGAALHRQAFTTGKPDTPTCATCHGSDARVAGRTPLGKVLEPMAVSVTPSRYSDPAKVEKWFKRNCMEVLGRECTASEKGDWLSFMFGQ